jgi:hypothetical protein
MGLDLEKLDRLNRERTRDLGDWEYEPAPNDEYITTIHGRFANGEPCGLGSMNIGTAEQQNADAEFVCALVNAADELIAIARAQSQSDGWLPIETAPKDGPPVLLKFKDDLSGFGRDLEQWQGRAFVGRHSGFTRTTNYDLGWRFAAPVGEGGFPDEWLEGWRALPAPPSPATEADQ